MSDQQEQADGVITAYKGFDSEMKCRGFQYEVGKTYEHEGNVEACSSGFHACEHPLDVLGYYPPVGSRFAVVEQAGKVSRHDGDTKVASSRISIKAEITLPALISAAFEFVRTRCEPSESQHATGYSSASSATGYSSASSATGDSSASSATGYSSASSATGDSSASSATGYSSASSATGYSSASSATGYRSASSATGDSSASLATGFESSSEIKADAEDKPLHAVAIATGEKSMARAPEGSAIVCVHRNDDGQLIHIRASKVGENGIKPNVYYALDADGNFVEGASE